jgi:hypothetical protein
VAPRRLDSVTSVSPIGVLARLKRKSDTGSDAEALRPKSMTPQRQHALLSTDSQKAFWDCLLLAASSPGLVQHLGSTHTPCLTRTCSEEMARFAYPDCKRAKLPVVHLPHCSLYEGREFLGAAAPGRGNAWWASRMVMGWMMHGVKAYVYGGEGGTWRLLTATALRYW